MKKVISEFTLVAIGLLLGVASSLIYVYKQTSAYTVKYYVTYRVSTPDEQYVFIKNSLAEGYYYDTREEAELDGLTAFKADISLGYIGGPMSIHVDSFFIKKSK